MPRLSDRQLALVNEYKPETMLDSALALAADGWNVFPLRPGTKTPLIGKKTGGKGAHDGTTDPDTIRRWWARHPNAGIGANLGDDRLAVDLDFQHGASRLSSLPETRTHHSGRGNGNIHLIYRFATDGMAAAIKSGTDVLGKGIDIRAGRGSYIVMPPTPHEETGEPYSLDPFLTEEHFLTDEDVQAIWEEAGVPLSAASRGAKKGLRAVPASERPQGSSNTTLAGLLADPPSEGGRNDWLARVAGHYAKQIRFKDAYDQMVQDANQKLVPPLDADEVVKTAESIWDSEHANHPERPCSLENGFLVGNKRALFCQVQQRHGEDIVYDTAPWADFDLECRGMAIDDAKRRTYWIRVHQQGGSFDTTLDAELLGNDFKTKSWLASLGLSWDTPFNAAPKTPGSTRLLRYLNSQNPPKVHIVSVLGWDPRVEGFVTHEGVITEDGPQTKESAGVVADPRLVERDVAPYRYGFQRTPQEAQRVLQEVLTFQEETTTSIFGAWWAACLLKPQIQDRSSLFPFFGVEAASESGKTNGFFDLMVALNGNTRGQIVPTRPVLRDYASAHHNGIVWADDLDSLDAYGELLRASTSNGTAAKMDADRTGIKNTQVVAPILVTGEALGFDMQKALIDRAVVLEVSSPRGRVSLHDPDRPQWDDVLDLKSQYPESQGGFSVLSGHFVVAALGQSQQMLRALAREQRRGSGRLGEKNAVLLAGARLLDFLTGHGEPWGEPGGPHYRRVLDWVAGQGEGLQLDNTFTLKVLPWAVRLWGELDKPERIEGGRFDGIPSPIFVRGDRESIFEDGAAVVPPDVELWVNVPALAQCWEREKGGRVDARTESPAGLQQQSRGVTDGSRSHRLANTGAPVKYRKLTPEYMEAVLRRADLS